MKNINVNDLYETADFAQLLIGKFNIKNKKFYQLDFTFQPAKELLPISILMDSIPVFSIVDYASKEHNLATFYLDGSVKFNNVPENFQPAINKIATLFKLLFESKNDKFKELVSVLYDEYDKYNEIIDNNAKIIKNALKQNKNYTVDVDKAGDNDIFGGISISKMQTEHSFIQIATVNIFDGLQESLILNDKNARKTYNQLAKLNLATA